MNIFTSHFLELSLNLYYNINPFEKHSKYIVYDDSVLVPLLIYNVNFIIVINIMV